MIDSEQRLTRVLEAVKGSVVLNGAAIALVVTLISGGNAAVSDLFVPGASFLLAMLAGVAFWGLGSTLPEWFGDQRRIRTTGLGVLSFTFTLFAIGSVWTFFETVMNNAPNQ